MYIYIYEYIYIYIYEKLKWLQKKQVHDLKNINHP